MDLSLNIIVLFFVMDYQKYVMSLIGSNFSIWKQQDNFSLSYDFAPPDFSEYYADPSVYDNSAHEYSSDTSSYYYQLDNKNDELPRYSLNGHDLFEKYKNEDGNISHIPLGLEFENDDASWVMACTFLIFTMHTGYGLIESGLCGRKNEVNILMRNALDVVLSGFVFWCFGYGNFLCNSKQFYNFHYLCHQIYI